MGAKKRTAEVGDSHSLAEDAVELARDLEALQVRAWRRRQVAGRGKEWGYEGTFEHVEVQIARLVSHLRDRGDEVVRAGCPHCARGGAYFNARHCGGCGRTKK